MLVRHGRDDAIVVVFHPSKMAQKPAPTRRFKTSLFQRDVDVVSVGLSASAGRVGAHRETRKLACRPPSPGSEGS